jgi:hypothetical protein
MTETRADCFAVFCFSWEQFLKYASGLFIVSTSALRRRLCGWDRYRALPTPASTAKKAAHGLTGLWRRPANPPQIQFWKIISRLNVSIDVPTNAADIGSIAAKPANAIATKAHNSQRGLLSRLSTYTSARLATVADGR